jgi:hypothetical protein
MDFLTHVSRWEWILNIKRGDKSISKWDDLSHFSLLTDDRIISSNNKGDERDG